MEQKHANLRQRRALASRRIWPALAIVALALLVRAAYLFDSSDNPTFSAPIVDSLRYDAIARDLAQGRGMSPEFFWQPLFYPLYLSAVYRVTDSSILAVKVIQAILGAFTCLLVFNLAAKLFNLKTAALAGIFAAVYMPLVFFESELLAVAWAAFWSVALVTLFLRAAEKPGVGTCLATGLCGCLSIITRPVFLPFFAAACAWLLVRWLKSRVSFRRLAPAAASIAAGFALIAIPVAITSFRVTGRPALLPLTGGINIYIGNNPDYRETIAIRPGAGWRRLTEMPIRDGANDLYQQDQWFYAKVRYYALTKPIDFAKGIACKTLQFVNSRELPRNLDIYIFRKWSAFLAAGVWKRGNFGFPFGLLMPLAVIGLVFQYRRIPAPLWLLLLLYPASVIIVFVTARYRMPMMPVMCLLAAAGIEVLWSTATNRRWKRLAACSAVALAAFGIAIIGPFYEEQLNYEPELYFAIGQSLSFQQRFDDAVHAYSKALALDDDYAEAHNNLGNTFFRLQRYAEAAQQYARAIETMPDNPVAHFNLGACFEQQQDLTEARRQYEIALTIDPQYGRARDAIQRLSTADKP